MKIDKKLIKELVDNLKEFELTELEYQEGQTKIKVSRASKAIEQIKTSAVVSPNKSVLKSSDESEGISLYLIPSDSHPLITFQFFDPICPIEYIHFHSFLLVLGFNNFDNVCV